MGSFIGNLVTKKKRKKLAKAISAESQLQVDLALETSELEREAQDIMLTRANAQMVQDRTQAAREARIRRAEIIAAGVNAGAGTSTAVQTASDSIYSQFTGAMGLQNVFAGFSSTLSGINEDISLKQSDIISSQGRQQQLGAKLQTQQEKAQMIGGAIDLGISVATAFINPAGAFASVASGFGKMGAAMGGIGTAATAAAGSMKTLGSTGSSNLLTNMFSRFR